MNTEGEASSSTGALTPSSFDDYNAALQSGSPNCYQVSAALPSDINFHRSIDSEFAQAIDDCSERALRLTNKLLDLAGSARGGKGRDKGKRKLEDEEDVVDSFGSLVIDVLDQLFEHAVRILCNILSSYKPDLLSGFRSRSTFGQN